MSKKKGRIFVKTEPMPKLKKQLRALKADVLKNTRMLNQTIEAKQIYRSNITPLAENQFDIIEVLDGLAQGVADTGTGATVSTGARIGNSINVKSITFNMLLDGTNYAVDPQNTTGKSGGLYTVIVYNSPCGDSLDEGDILREASTTVRAMKSHYKVDIEQGKMYEIWSDRLVCLSNAKPCANLDFTKSWKHGKQVLYDNNTTSPSNFKPRVLVIGYNNKNDDNFHYSIKVRYEDL